MDLTQALKAWCVEHKGIKEDAEDSAFKDAVAKALVDGSLSPEKLAELTEKKEDKEASSVLTLLESIKSGQDSLTERVTKIEKGETGDKGDDADGDKGGDKGGEKGGNKSGLKDTAPGAPGDDGGGSKPEKSVFEKMFANGGVNYPEDGDTAPLIRTIGPDEQYSTDKQSLYFPKTFGQNQLKHPFAGQRLFVGGSEGIQFLEGPSELDRAVNGAYFKWVINCNTRGVVHKKLRMTDHDKQLIQYALHEMKWAGIIGGEGDEDSGAIGLMGDRKLTPHQQKAILDDAASGGLEIAPIVFDDAIITTPILSGEFFPFVNVVNITRGRRIEGGSIGNVTLNSGGADGTAIPLFNTASFISAFDTNIFVVDGAIEIGLDFLSDSPVGVADIVTQQYGQVLLNWLDEQVNIGDGTTEPEGVHNASGTVSVNASNGAGGPPTVGDYESLLFGVSKKFKQGATANRLRFGANETTYQRARAIPVGNTDERRVFGMTHEDYRLLNHAFGIGEFFTNRQSNFTNWARYRMYRRMGLTMRATTEGKELVRANQMLIAARARFGGQLEDGNASAIIADGQS